MFIVLYGQLVYATSQGTWKLGIRRNGLTMRLRWRVGGLMNKEEVNGFYSRSRDRVS